MKTKYKNKQSKFFPSYLDSTIFLNNLHILYTYICTYMYIKSFNQNIFPVILFIFRPDTTLQAIVYKLVPGLYERELMRKRAFYKDRPTEAAMATPEQRGEDTEHLIFSPSDCMSLSLEFADTE